MRAINIQNNNAPNLNILLSAKQVCIEKFKPHDKNVFRLLYKLNASALNRLICLNTNDKNE